MNPRDIGWRRRRFNLARSSALFRQDGVWVLRGLARQGAGVLVARIVVGGLSTDGRLWGALYSVSMRPRWDVCWRLRAYNRLKCTETGSQKRQLGNNVTRLRVPEARTDRCCSQPATNCVQRCPLGSRHTGPGEKRPAFDGGLERLHRAGELCPDDVDKTRTQAKGRRYFE